MSLVFVLVVILVVAGVLLLISGRWTGPVPVERDRRPDGDGFDVVLRGYRMDEVDARIAELEAELDRARRSGRGSTGTGADS